MTGAGRRFDPSELLSGTEADPTEAELADAYAAARILEAHATADGIRPTDGFEDRVMAAIATEPIPRLVVRPGAAVRGGGLAAIGLALGDAWAIATTGGRPLAIRAQALGVILVVGILAVSLTGFAAVSVGSLLAPQPSPTPAIEPSVSPSPSPSAAPSSTSPSPTVSPAPSSTLEPSASPTEGTGGEATETPDATETLEPGETLRPGETLKPGETLRPGETLKPGERLRPGETLKPGETRTAD